MKKVLSLLLITITLLSVSCIPVFADDYDETDGYDYNENYDDTEDYDYGEDNYYSDTDESSSGNNSGYYYYDENGNRYYINGDYDYFDSNDAPDIYTEEGLKETLEEGSFLKSEHAYLKDEAGVVPGLTATIFDKIKQTADIIDMNVGVFIGGKNRSDHITEDFTALACERVFGKGEYTNTVFLYLDFEGSYSSYDFIDTYHDAYFYYPDNGSDNRIEKIFQDMGDYLPASGEPVYADKVNSAIEVFLGDLKMYKEAGMVNNLFYKNAETNMYHITFFGTVIISPIVYKHLLIFLLIALVAAFLFGFSHGSKIRRTYSFRDSTSASAYTTPRDFFVVAREDNFIKEYTTSYRIESSSSGSHSHSGGGHHSSVRSSSHHGGGHHR